APHRQRGDLGPFHTRARSPPQTQRPFLCTAERREEAAVGGEGETGDGFFPVRERDRRGISGGRPDPDLAGALAGGHQRGVGRERNGVDVTARGVDGIEGGDLRRGGRWRRAAAAGGG